jgi:hypothetical protein
LKINTKSNTNRFYRNQIREQSLQCFQVLVAETDLCIYANQDLTIEAYECVINCRSQLETFIHQHPTFATSLTPWTDIQPAPKIVRQMIDASQCAGVGPMASVAGLIAEMVGTKMLQYSAEVIVENGGDLFIHKKQPFNVGIYAGDSPFSNRIGIHVDCADESLSICTSSAVIGHSLSFGNADAVTIRARSAVLADAVATATSNRVKSRDDISNAINFAKNIAGVEGVLVLIGDVMGAWGKIEIVPMNIH